MAHKEVEDRGMDDIRNTAELSTAQRVFAALMHPDNPMPMFDMDARKLSRHISLRINRFGRGRNAEQF